MLTQYGQAWHKVRSHIRNTLLSCVMLGVSAFLFFLIVAFLQQPILEQTTQLAIVGQDAWQIYSSESQSQTFTLYLLGRSDFRAPLAAYLGLSLVIAVFAALASTGFLLGMKILWSQKTKEWFSTFLFSLLILIGLRFIGLLIDFIISNEPLSDWVQLTTVFVWLSLSVHKYYKAHPLQKWYHQWICLLPLILLMPNPLSAAILQLLGRIHPSIEFIVGILIVLIVSVYTLLVVVEKYSLIHENEHKTRKLIKP